MIEKKCVGLKERIEFNEDFKLDWHDTDEATDGYQLKWIGKDYARLQSGMQTETVIIPDTKHNEKEENKNSENLFFTGDNLEVLRHLQNAYSNSIKMIYIDPPYNTGGEFVYNDKFEYTDEQLKEMLGITDEEIKRLHTINGRSSHSAWLTFMYPRLKIAKKLLKEDGVIFISIDDNEQANLKLLCDEIFGEDYVDVMIWRKSGAGRDGKMKNTSTFRKDHEYIIVCFNNQKYLNKSFEKPNYENEYGNPDNDPRGPWSSGSISRAEYASNENSEKYYEVISPTGKKITRQFDIPKEDFIALDKDGRISWGKDGNSIPRIKTFIYEKREVTTSSYIIENSQYISESCIDEHDSTTTQGSKCLDELFGTDGLGSEIRPKPVDLIYKLIQIGSNENDIVIDFFAGSATTAHSIFKFNAEENALKRKFILVQIPQEIDSQKVAYQLGHRTIDSLARKRIELASKKIKEETNANIDYGFKHYYVKEADVNTINKITEFDPEKNTLIADDMINEFDNDYSNGKDVILTTWLVSDGYKLNQEIKEIDFCGYKAHYIDNSFLYLIDNNWNKEQTKGLLNKIGERKININTIIVYGYSFTMESLRELETNIKQNFDNKIQIEKRY